MSKSSGSLLTTLINFLASLFRGKEEVPQSTIPDSPDEPAEITISKVLVIVYNPTMNIETGEKLIDQMGWGKPEDLATGFMADILQVSGGMARYQVVERVDVDTFPAKMDGFTYSPQSYMDVLRGVVKPYPNQDVDYYAILSQFNILGRVAKGEIDEVWVFGFPYAGFYESRMAGANPFWCNAPALKNTDAAGRRFVIMGFSYERGVGEMLESFSHRVESIMTKTFERKLGEYNLWNRYIRYENTAPGKAALGNIHFAPNSERDYDWNNPNKVKSECDDWLNNFPEFKGVTRLVNADDWGNGDIRAHHRWWLKHIPRVSGRQGGIHNNWWQYIIKPEKVGK